MDATVTSRFDPSVKDRREHERCVDTSHQTGRTVPEIHDPSQAMQSQFEQGQYDRDANDDDVHDVYAHSEASGLGTGGQSVRTFARSACCVYILYSQLPPP